MVRGVPAVAVGGANDLPGFSKVPDANGSSGAGEADPRSGSRSFSSKRSPLTGSLASYGFAHEPGAGAAGKRAGNSRLSQRPLP